jgi:hypothetical protein
MQGVKNKMSFSLIEENSIPEPNSGCWIWLLALLPNGYGTISVDGKTRGAHRLSFSLHNNTTPRKSDVVRHSCDFKACVNPDHLSIGTAWDNSQDAVRRGKTAAGVNHPAAKLSPASASVIRERISAGETQGSIARDMGVGQSTISRVNLRQVWK